MQQRLQRMGVERALARAGATRRRRRAHRRPRARRTRSPAVSVAIAVVKIGTSSITDARRASSTTTRSSKLARRSRGARARRAPRRARHVGRDRGGHARARADDAPDRHGHAAGDRRGRPAAAVRAHERVARRARHRRRPGAAHAVRLRAPQSQYLHARETLQRLLDLGVLPIVNENDTVADDEIRYGDNDRLAALVVAPARRRRAA